jgi:hypothetical protein
MATRRTTSDKRQRERAKQAKAAAKRERRQDRSTDAGETTDADAPTDEDLTTEQLVARIEALHADYDAGNVTFEDFDEQKSDLLDRIALRLAQ